jgi:outer membrane protein TolC
MNRVVYMLRFFRTTFFKIIFFSHLLVPLWSHAQEEQSLTLEDAILLAVRENPNVQASQLNYISTKYNVWIQEWKFRPHYAFQASALVATTRTAGTDFGSHTYNVEPSISLLTPIGTEIKVLATNQKTTFYHPGLSIEVIQPLIRGFGKPIVEADLNDAKDNKIISELNIEGTLRSTVTGVINAYLDVIGSKQNVTINEEALSRAERSVKQTELFIKAGSKAGNELVTVKADVASAQSELINAKNMLLQARFALLTAIGIDPNTQVSFTQISLRDLINKYQIPSMDRAKELILANDIQYQTNQILIAGSKSRALMIAKDNTRWQLNFTVNAVTGNGALGGKSAGLSSLVNGFNQARSAGLTLNIPIDDQIAKQSVANAKIAIEEANLAILQEKWGLETNAINIINSVGSAKRSLKFAQDAEQLQEKTFQLNYQKYVHGLIDSLSLQTAQLQLIKSQQTLLSARINYLKQLVKLDEVIGNSLNTWHVKVRCG